MIRMLTRCVVCCWALLFGAVVPATDQRPMQPDVLLIMPDQMRGDCLSILGHPAVQTPTFDRLARQGMLFRRAYATVPSCIPARHALLTGLYPQTSGVVGFRQKPITRPTMPQVLAAAGYQTALVGREMHQAADAAQLGYEVAVLGSTYKSDDQYAAAVMRAVPEIRDFRKWVEGLGLSYNHWQAMPWPLSDDLHPTTWVIQQSRRVLAEAAKDRPLILTTSFYAPHPPLFPPAEVFEANLKKDLPPTARGDWVDWDSLTHAGTDGGQRVLLAGDRLRKAQAGYFGLIEQIDREIAPLIAEFKARSEQAGRPWAVVLTSDHGEMLGDHGYFRKCEPFEGSANIPFIVCGSPELGFRSGQRFFEPVCLEDLLPTFAQLADTDCPKVAADKGDCPLCQQTSELDGISLVPVLRGEQTEIRPWLHFEHAICYSPRQAFHALTDGRFKYIWRPLDGRELLFDLERDPAEERDLSLDASRQEQLQQWRNRLIERLAPRPEGFSDGQRLIAGRPYPPLNTGVPNPERH
jgi:arylsulfatase